MAAAVVGVPLEVLGDDEPVLARIAAGRFTRLRDLGAPSDPVLRAAAGAGVDIDRRRPVAAGPVEIPRWCREQAVSVTRHRYGNLRRH
jgi:RHH-type proline utilization regulon transcriptional repressor/proline dehydrogenase/delta 1-pyrroline-5-carboxylate dehydrogenase